MLQTRAVANIMVLIKSYAFGSQSSDELNRKEKQYWQNSERRCYLVVRNMQRAGWLTNCTFHTIVCPSFMTSTSEGLDVRGESTATNCRFKRAQPKQAVLKFKDHIVNKRLRPEENDFFFYGNKLSQREFHVTLAPTLQPGLMRHDTLRGLIITIRDK